MSDKRIIYKKNEASISSDVRIIIPTPEGLQSMTVEQIAQKDVPTGLKYKIVDVSEISSDRTFRNAWTIDEAELTDGVGRLMAITIDITKAKEVWKDKIRIKRAKTFKTLDLDFMKAQEAGSDTSAIVTKKNTLRDLPAQVDSATTTDEIKAVWNDLLGDK